MATSQIEINTVCMNAVMSCFEKGQQWSGFVRNVGASFLHSRLLDLIGQLKQCGLLESI